MKNPTISKSVHETEVPALRECNFSGRTMNEVNIQDKTNDQKLNDLVQKITTRQNPPNTDASAIPEAATTKRTINQNQVEPTDMDLLTDLNNSFLTEMCVDYEHDQYGENIDEIADDQTEDVIPSSATSMALKHVSACNSSIKTKPRRENKTPDNVKIERMKNLVIQVRKDNVKALIQSYESGGIDNLEETDRKYGLTLLHWAAMCGSIECIHWLMLIPEVHPNVQCLSLKLTPMHVAAIRGQDASIEALLHGNKYQNTTDSRDRFPLHLAAAHGKTQCIERMLKRGLLLHIEKRDILGWRPIHHASFNGRTGVIQTLIRYGAICNAVDNDGNNCLHLAAMEGHLTAIKLLLYSTQPVSGVNLLMDRNNEGFTPAMLAQRYYKTDIHAWLQQAMSGNFFRDRFEDFAYPAHVAALRGELESLQRYLDNGDVNINERDIYGYTLLHRAVVGGDKAVVEFLLDRGANIKTKNDATETALDIARRYDNQEILDFLLKVSIGLDVEQEVPLIESTDGDGVKFDLERTHSAKVRAKERVETCLQLLQTSIENFYQLGGTLEMTDTYAKLLTHLKERERQVDELNQQLYHERIVREELQGKLDVVQRLLKATEKERVRIQLDYDEAMAENFDLRDLVGDQTTLKKLKKMKFK